MSRWPGPYDSTFGSPMVHIVPMKNCRAALDTSPNTGHMLVYVHSLSMVVCSATLSLVCFSWSNSFLLNIFLSVSTIKLDGVNQDWKIHGNMKIVCFSPLLTHCQRNDDFRGTVMTQQWGHCQSSFSTSQDFYQSSSPHALETAEVTKIPTWRGILEWWYPKMLGLFHGKSHLEMDDH